MVKCNPCPVKSIGMSEEVDWGSEVSLTVRKYALQNSIEYSGKGESGSVLGRVLSERADLRNRAKELLHLVNEEVRLANLLFEEKGSNEVVYELESIDPKALEREKHKKAEGLKDLPGDTSQVVLRFAPNPNGPLSIGHSRGVVINSAYAEMYGGSVVLRFDDTDTKVKPPIIDDYGWIEEEYEWLAGRPADVVIRASERMPVYLGFAEKMLAEGHGYVCRCKAEDFRTFRESKMSCPCRGRGIPESLEDWSLMNTGGLGEGDAVVRVRTDMTLPNPALRDWPALRIQHSPHPIVGNKYRVWPLLDFQSAIEDHEQGVTHIIRGKDLMDSTRKQTLLYEHFGWEYPEPLYWGRVKVHEFGGFSTSGMLASIEEGEYGGWDDARLPTLKALRKRGFEAQPLRDLWGEVGLTQNDIAISMKTLESINSAIIDSNSERRSFVANPVEVNVLSEFGSDKVMIPRHPEESVAGSRIWDYDSSVLIQSSDFGNGKLRFKDLADMDISGSDAEIESEERTDSRPIIHWLPKKMAREAVLEVPDGGSITEVPGVIEDFELEVGAIYQLERVGFARIESLGEGPVRLLWLHK